MASVVVTAPPTAPAVSYEEARAHLRFYAGDNPDEGQAYIEALLAAAEQHLAAPFGWLGRSIALQTLEIRTCGFGWCGIQLPYGPVRSVVGVRYDDENGDEQTVDPSVYEVTGIDTVTAHVRLKSGQAWPSASLGRENVRIAYTAGYETEDVPPPLKHAILLLVSHWYEQRENVAAAQHFEVPATVQALCSTFRIWSV